MDVSEGEDERAQYSFCTFLETEAGGRCRELLRQPEVRQQCIAALGAVCPPPAPHLVFFCLEKILVGAISWIGHSAGSRLDQLIMKWKPLRSFFLKLESMAR